jgi:hypothetical protein
MAAILRTKAVVARNDVILENYWNEIQAFPESCFPPWAQCITIERYLYDYNYSPVQDELQKRTISIHFSSHPSTVAMKWYKQLQSQKYLNK